MKKTILFFLIFLSSFFTKGQWTQTNGPAAAYPNSFARITSGIFCGSASSLYFSSDEGQTWQSYAPFESSKIYSLLTFSDTLVVLYSHAVSDNIYSDSIMCNTSYDGGLSWQTPVYFNLARIFSTKMEHLGSNTIACTTEGLFRSTDFGRTWSSLALPMGIELYSSQIFGNYIFITTKNNLNKYYFLADTNLNFQRIDTFDIYTNKLIMDSVIIGCKTLSPGYHQFYNSSDYGVTWNAGAITDSIMAFETYTFNDSLFHNTQTFQFMSSSDYGNSFTTCQRPHQLFFPLSLPLQNGNEIAYTTLSQELVYYIPSIDSFYTSDHGTKDQRISIILSKDSFLYCTGNNLLYRSNDAGNTWEKRGGIYPDPEEILVFGDSIFYNKKYFWRSFDGGQTWSTTIPPGFSSYSSIARKDNRFFVANYDGVHYTDNLGIDWTTLPTLPINTPCGNVNYSGGKICLLENNIFLVTSEGVVFKLDSSDSFWTYNFCFPLEDATNSSPEIKTLDGKLIIMCDSTLFISNDQGLTWNSPALNGIPMDTNNEKISPKKIILSNGQLVGISGTNSISSSVFNIYISYNDGEDWTDITPGNPQFFPSCLATFNNQLFVGSMTNSVWTEGTILRTPTIYHSETNDISVYPNPTKENFTIRISNINAVKYILNLSDLLGNSVSTISIENESTLINTANLTPGIYIGQLKSDNGKIKLGFKIMQTH